MTRTSTPGASTDPKPRVRTPEVAAAYLFNRVKRMQSEEAGVIEAARMAHRNKIDALVKKQPAEVQKAYRALSFVAPAPSSTETDG